MKTLLTGNSKLEFRIDYMGDDEEKKYPYLLIIFDDTHRVIFTLEKGEEILQEVLKKINTIK